jgi:hypothetical protein
MEEGTIVALQQLVAFLYITIRTTPPIAAAT